MQKCKKLQAAWACWCYWLKEWWIQTFPHWNDSSPDWGSMGFSCYHDGDLSSHQIWVNPQKMPFHKVAWKRFVPELKVKYNMNMSLVSMDLFCEEEKCTSFNIHTSAGNIIAPTWCWVPCRCSASSQQRPNEEFAEIKALASHWDWAPGHTSSMNTLWNPILLTTI